MARQREAGAAQSLGPLARSALALGCTALLPRHYRVIRRLADYGFFHAGGLLIGSHAFLAYQRGLTAHAASVKHSRG
jgi:hypothetical protein